MRRAPQDDSNPIRGQQSASHARLAMCALALDSCAPILRAALVAMLALVMRRELATSALPDSSRRDQGPHLVPHAWLGFIPLHWPPLHAPRVNRASSKSAAEVSAARRACRGDFRPARGSTYARHVLPGSSRAQAHQQVARDACQAASRVHPGPQLAKLVLLDTSRQHHQMPTYILSLTTRKARANLLGSISNRGRIRLITLTVILVLSLSITTGY